MMSLMAWDREKARPREGMGTTVLGCGRVGGGYGVCDQMWRGRFFKIITGTDRSIGWRLTFGDEDPQRRAGHGVAERDEREADGPVARREGVDEEARQGDERGPEDRGPGGVEAAEGGACGLGFLGY